MYRHGLKEDMKWSQIPILKKLTIIIHQENADKIIQRYHFTFMRIGMNSRILKTDMEELEWGVVTNVCKHSIWGGVVRVSMLQVRHRAGRDDREKLEPSDAIGRNAEWSWNKREPRLAVPHNVSDILLADGHQFHS